MRGLKDVFRLQRLCPFGDNAVATIRDARKRPRGLPPQAKRVQPAPLGDPSEQDPGQEGSCKKSRSWQICCTRDEEKRGCESGRQGPSKIGSQAELRASKQAECQTFGKGGDPICVQARTQSKLKACAQTGGQTDTQTDTQAVR